jgi:glutamate N-acetyltransferase/amino-acid N-acetyltransferase
VLAAVGTTDAAFDPDRLDVAFNGVWVCRDGAEAPAVDGAVPAVDISARALEITVELHAGDVATEMWTNDLTLAYVHENSAYTS